MMHLKNTTGGGCLSRTNLRRRSPRKLRLTVFAAMLALVAAFAVPQAAKANVLDDLANGAAQFFSPIVQFFTGDDGVQTLDDEAGVWTPDSNTQDSWRDGTEGVGTEVSTKNTGRIWTDKSVYSGNATLTNTQNQETVTIQNDEGTALVGLSALSSAANINGVTYSTKPVDIVLVLDVSGSMDENMGGGYEYTEVYEGDLDHARTYYVQYYGSYREVEWRNAWTEWGERYEAGWYYDSWMGRWTRYTPKTSESDDSRGHTQFYERGPQQPVQNKLVALKNAVNGFIDSVDKNNENKSDSEKSRVSIVKFAADQYYREEWQSGRRWYYGDDQIDKVGDDLQPSTGHNFTQVVSDFSSDASSLKDAVNGLKAEGATAADFGLNLAGDVLAGTDTLNGARQNEDVQKVVIFFTDGSPTYSNGYSESVAATAVNAALELKQSGTTIYSIGVFDQADPSDTAGQFNKYMHAVSSNYPNASAEYSNTINYNGQQSEDPHYFAADNADDLSAIFGQISSSFDDPIKAESPVAGVDGESEGAITFTDVLGDYTEVKDLKSIVFWGTQYTQKSSSIEGNVTTYTFSDSVTIPDEGGQPNAGQTISLGEITIRVTKSPNNLAQGDIVEVTIPARLLPMRIYNVNSTTDVDGNTTVTTTLGDAYPIRVYYTVGLKDGVFDAEGNIDGTKVANTAVKDGNYVFYSNDYESGDNGTTQVTFTPAETNSFYYFTSDTPLYTSENGEKADSYKPDTKYWYQRPYFDASTNAMQTEWVSFTAQDGQADGLDAYVQQDSDGTYYIREGAPRLTRAHEFVGKKSGNESGTAANAISPSWNGTGGVTVSLGNNAKITYPAAGSLEISKTVDDWGNADDTTKASTFEFTVDLDGLTNEYSWQKYAGETKLEGDGATGSISADNNTITLAAGQRVVISDLPANAAFKVTETAKDGFTVTDNSSGDTTDGIVEGTIPAGAQATAAFTNAYKANDLVLEDENSLKLQKTVTGASAPSDFAFQLSLNTEKTQTAGGDTSAVTVDSATASVVASDLQLGEGEASKTSGSVNIGKVTFTKPGTYVFDITETSIAAPNSGWTYDKNAHTVTVKVEDNHAGQLVSTSVVYDNTASTPDASITNIAAFTNSYKANPVVVGGGQGQGQIGVTKIVEGMDPTDNRIPSFNFKLELTGATNGGDVSAVHVGEGTDQPVIGSDGVVKTISAGAYNTDGEATVGFGALTFTQAGDYTFKVTEIEARDNEKDPAGWTFDDTEKTVVVHVTDAGNDGQLDAVIGEAGVYDTTFTNSYETTPVTFGDDPTEVIGGHKYVLDETGAYTIADGQYQFVMRAQKTEGQPDAPVPTGDNVTAGEQDGLKHGLTTNTDSDVAEKSASYDFGQITFTEPGTYYYNVFENENYNHISGINYSKVAYTVKFVVEDIDSELTVTEASAVQIVGGEGSVDLDKLDFTNEYVVNELPSSMWFLKRMNRDFQSGDTFTFDVTLSAVGNDGLALAQDDYPTFTKDDTATYSDLEWDQQSGGYSYEIAISPQNTATGSSYRFNSGTFTYTHEGVYTYTVSEQSSTVAGVTEDSREYEVEVTISVVEDAEGNPIFSRSVKVNGKEFETGTLDFVNTYDPEEAVLSGDDEIVVTKKVEGAPTDSAFNFDLKLISVADGGSRDAVRVGSDDQALAISSDGVRVTVDGGFADGEQKEKGFGALTFTKTGTYTFTISEVEADSQAPNGWTYDNDDVKVVVRVTDPGFDGKLDIAVDDYDATFVNRYKPQGVTTGEGDTADLSVTKKVTGAATSDDFEFALKLKSVANGASEDGVRIGNTDDSPALDQNGVSAKVTEDFADGQSHSASFGPLTFTKVGDYTFTVSEVNADGEVPENWTYDNSEKTIVVHVTDNGFDGQLDIAVGDGIEGNNPVFVNTYFDEGTAKSAQTTNADGGVTSENGTMAGVGDTITYTIKWANDAVDNSGVPKIADVLINDTVPTGTELVDGSIKVNGENAAADSYTVTNDMIAWTLKDQQPGATGTVSFSVKVLDVAGGTTVRNSAYFDNDPNVTTNTVETVIPGKDVTIESGDDSIKVGDVLTYTITYANTTGEAATVTVTDTLPDSLTFVEDKGATEGAPSFLQNGQMLTWTFESLGAGVSGTITFTVRVNEKAVIEGIGNTATVTVGNNSYTTDTTPDDRVGSGGLTITKQVTVDANSGLTVDADKLFGFTVALTGSDGAPLPGTYTVTDAVNAEGEAVSTIESGDTIYLKHGGSAIISGLPQGAGYSVQELSYSDVGYVTTTPDNAVGTIAADGATVVFTNSYTAEQLVLTGDAALEVKKVVTGASAPEDFTFSIALAGTNQGPDGGVATDLENVTATTFKDKLVLTEGATQAETTASFGDIAFTKPGVYTFVIKEATFDPATANGWTYANKEEDANTVTVEVVDNKSGKLVLGEVEYFDANGVEIQDGVATFVNSYTTGNVPVDDGDAKLSIVKNMTGRAIGAGEFAFTMKGADDTSKLRLNEDGEPLEIKTTGAQLQGNEASETISVNTGMTFTFEDAGKTYTYTVAEVIPGGATNDAYPDTTYEQVSDDQKATPGWKKDGVTYDTTEYKVEFVVTDAGGGTLKVETFVNGELLGDAESAINALGTATPPTFNNSYDAGSTTVGGNDGVRINATKTLKNDDIADYVGEFNFQVKSGDTVVATGSNNANGGKGITFSEIVYTTKKLNAAVTVEGSTGDGGVGKAGLEKDEQDNNVYTFTYEVVELDPTDSLGVSQVTDEPQTVFVKVTDNNGTLSAEVTYPGEANGIDFVNAYGDASEKQIKLEGNKVIKGANEYSNPPKLQGDDYTFTLTGSDGAPMPDGATDNTATATNHADGFVTFGPITFTMENVFGDDPTTDETTDPDEGEAGTTDGEESTEGNTESEGDTTNDGGATTDEGSTTEGENADGETTNGDTTEDVVTDGTQTDDATSTDSGAAGSEDATEKDDESATSDDATLPSNEEPAVALLADEDTDVQAAGRTETFTYTIQETDGHIENVNNDTSVKTVTVTVTDLGGGKLDVKVTSDPGADEGMDFTFTNTYTVNPVGPTEPTDGTIGVIKKLTGRELKDGDFTFEMKYDGESTAVTPTSITTTNSNSADGSGDVEFGNGFTFSEPGTYDFTIREVAGSEKGMTYDSTTYTVRAKVTDNANGTLSCEWVLLSNGAAVTENPTITFTNVYDEPYVPPIEPDDPDESDPSKPDLDVDKTLTGRDIVAGEFSFKITATGSNADHVSPKTLTGSVDASGNVTFPGEGFTFDEAGDYSFTLSEVLPQDDDPETPGVQHNGVTYDETTYDVTAKVTNGAGNKLVAKWDLGTAAGGVTFKNAYEPDETANVSLGATKVLNGRDLVAGEFTFELVDGQGNVVATATNAADGSVFFSSIEFTEAGTYTYLIREVAGSLANVTYDTATHTATVTVTDNGDGTLTATVLYDGSGSLPVFTNTYKVPEEPGQPERPGKPGKPEEPKKPATPDTGDHTNAAAPVALALSGAALVAGAYVLRVRRNR